MTMVPVNEIFQTIQGEATFTGTPAIFVRLHGCDVGCAFCDTKHTWSINPENEVTVSEMLEKIHDSAKYAFMNSSDIIEALSQYQARHVVITGGEPCQYDLRDLTRQLIKNNFTVQIETSGTVEVFVNNAAFVTVSPKINMQGGLSICNEAIARANEIKHPVGKQRDIELLRLSILPYVREGVPVWLQPLSQNKTATALCIKAATEFGFRVSIQTHKFIGVR